MKHLSSFGAAYADDYAPPDVAELDEVLHASEPDYEGFTEHFSLLTDGC